MAVRVAILGDSHVACVALASRALVPESFRPTFFAYPLRHREALVVDGGRLRIDSDPLRSVLRGTSVGLEEIDPGQYDFFVLMGLEFEFPFDCLGQQFYSRAVTEQATRDFLTGSLAFSTLAKLRSVTRRPVWVVHAPLKDVGSCNARPGVLSYARFLEIADEVFGPLGASVLPQPEETRIDDYFTRPEFSLAAVRLGHSDASPFQVEDDNCHKNEVFGRAIVRDLRVRFESLRADEIADSSAARADAWRPRNIGTIHERDDDSLTVRLPNGAGVRLNSTAGLIWEYCDGSRTESEILAELGTRFGMATDLLCRDFREALEGLINAGALELRFIPVQPAPELDTGSSPGIDNRLRVRLGLVSETSEDFVNQVKLFLFSLRKNGGGLSRVPVTLITNGDALSEHETRFLAEHFAPIDFRTSPKLGAIPHTSKLNVFYSIDPSEYDVLLFMDCDTVVRRPLDRILDPVVHSRAQFVCRRGGTTDRNMFLDFNALVQRFCVRGPKDKIVYDGEQEWPMFNSGVFLATAETVQRIRRCSVEFTYRLFNQWQKASALQGLPEDLRQHIKIRQIVRQNWTIEQGALALACINAGVKVHYLDESYNSWGGDQDFHVLHCFKSLYRFDRNSMFRAEAEQWIAEYAASDIPGKIFLASILREYKHKMEVPCPRQDLRQPGGAGPSEVPNEALLGFSPGVGGDLEVANALNIDSLAQLPALRYCCDSPDQGLWGRFNKVIQGAGVSNIFNPSFHESSAATVFAFRAIPDEQRESVSFVSVENEYGSRLIRIAPELFPGVEAPRLIDPKVFTVGEAVYLTFNSGWLASGKNDIFVMQVHPQPGEPFKVIYEGRRRLERNWAFFSEDGQVYAIYRVAPLVLLKLEHTCANSWRMVEHVRRQSTDLPHDLTLGTQPCWHAGRYYFMAHRKYIFKRKKVYLGRLCALDTASMSVSAGADWIVHSPESLLGSMVKHNTNLFSCTYFSGLQASGQDIVLGYGINDADFGFSRYPLGALMP